MGMLNMAEALGADRAEYLTVTRDGAEALTEEGMRLRQEVEDSHTARDRLLEEIAKLTGAPPLLIRPIQLTFLAKAVK